VSTLIVRALENLPDAKGRQVQSLPPNQSDYYFGKQVLVWSSHFLSAIFSHSACVAGVEVWAKAGAMTAAAMLRAMTVMRDFIGGFSVYSVQRVNAALCRRVPWHTTDFLQPKFSLGTTEAAQEQHDARHGAVKVRANVVLLRNASLRNPTLRLCGVLRNNRRSAS
jgi:hypothetical protein